jgi:hypothetical protein
MLTMPVQLHLPRKRGICRQNDLLAAKGVGREGPYQRHLNSSVPKAKLWGVALVLGDALRELQSGSSYVRPIEGDRRFLDKFIEALGSVEDLCWRQELGYFHWHSTDGLDSGTLPYNCHTVRFGLLIVWVTMHRPACLDDLADGGWLV